MINDTENNKIVEELAKAEKINENMIKDIKQESSEEETELLRFVEESKPKVFVVGAGGSGSNTLNRLFELGVEGATFIAANTDARHLLKIKAHKKVLLGKNTTKGRGAGSNPEVGEVAAKESSDEINGVLKDPTLVFLTCGLGGGTGTGSIPIIAEQAKKMGALTIAVVTLPFTSEGRVRMDNALKGLEKLKRQADTIIMIKNDKLLTLAPDLPLNTAFKVSDEVLAGAVKGIAELVTKVGLVNLDFADLKTILQDAGYAVIGFGDVSADLKCEERAMVAIETALNSPLIDADISSVNKALVNVVGGSDMTLKEAELVVAETAKRIRQDSHIIWGARIDENMQKSTMRVLVVLAGAKFHSYDIETLRELSSLDLDLIG